MVVDIGGGVVVVDVGGDGHCRGGVVAVGGYNGLVFFFLSSQ